MERNSRLGAMGTGCPGALAACTIGLMAALAGCWEDTSAGAKLGLGADEAGAGGVEADTGAGRCDEMGARRCTTGSQREICRPPFGWEPTEACPEGDRCVEGACLPPIICEAGQTRCRDVSNLEICNAEGTAWDVSRCDGECRQTGGGGMCDDAICIPGERTCNGSFVVVECGDDGTTFEFVQRCNDQRTPSECDRGACVPVCLLNEKEKTNVGCDYWAVDLDNAFVPGGETGFLDAAASQYSVVVSNPNDTFTAEVKVFTNEDQVDVAVVPPLGLHVFNLERRDVDGTVLARRAYRVKSSVPIIAYQFNPLENVDVFSNDASLLLPSHVLGDRYFVMTREQSFELLRGYLTVVAIEENEPTTVTVTVTALTRPGVGGIPALQPGESHTFTLEQFDVLNLETNAPGADLTGSLVEASANVVVFGGSEAANAPNTNHCIEIDPITGEGHCEYKDDEPCSDNYDCNAARLNTCCADHLEQQLFPVDTWGRHYIATKSFDRGLEADYWRILASQDNTKVETVPPQAMIPTLNAGEWFEFESRAHFEILSDKPVMVGQFLASQQAPDPNLRQGIEEGDAATGDPAFILAVPVEQFREKFVFLAPDKYAFDYVSIIAPTAAEVAFDEAPVPVSWEPVGDGAEWHMARFAISDGVHFIDADRPLSVIVYGYDQYVSYGYPGGLNLDVEPGQGQPVGE